MKNCPGSRALPGLIFLLAQSAFGQSQPFLYSVTFRGTSYETNGTGSVVTRTMTETTLLQDIAAAAGMSDISGWALVYHVAGSVFGDTIDVVNSSNGTTLDTVFGFYFGSDLSLGRMALTNAFNTQERRVDQLYTKQSQFALGSAFVTKRSIIDTRGNVRATIDADMHYLVRPQGGASARLCIGSFTTTRPFKPR